MEESEGMYAYDIPNEERPALQDEENSLFFNGSEYPLQWNDDFGSYIYNFNGEGRIILDSPAYVVWIKDSHINVIASDTNAIENTTVKILKKVSSGGSSNLPPAGANGNVLTADDGEWISAAPQDNSVIVTANLGNTESFPNITINQPSMSAAEIIAAAEKPVTMIAQDESGYIIFVASLSVVKNGVATFLGYAYYHGDAQYVAQADVYDDDNETFVALDLNQLPPRVSNLDNGKILGVNNNGMYVLVNGIPPYTASEAGYILKVNASGTGLEWVAP